MNVIFRNLNLLFQNYGNLVEADSVCCEGQCDTKNKSHLKRKNAIFQLGTRCTKYFLNQIM